MLTHHRVPRLISSIYDAVGDSDRWQNFLEQFAEAVDGTITTLTYHDLTHLRASLIVTARGDPEAERRYLECFSTRDVYRAAWIARFRTTGPNTVYTDEQLIAPAELAKTEYFNDFLLVSQCGLIT